MLFQLLIPLIALAASHEPWKMNLDSNVELQYRPQETGPHSLVLIESGKELQQLHFILKKEEYFSESLGFQCFVKDETIYAIISQKRAKKKGKFKAERGWSFSQEEKKMNIYPDYKKILCMWPKESVQTYPFKK